MKQHSIMEVSELSVKEKIKLCQAINKSPTFQSENIYMTPSSKAKIEPESKDETGVQARKLKLEEHTYMVPINNSKSSKSFGKSFEMVDMSALHVSPKHQVIAREYFTPNDAGQIMLKQTFDRFSAEKKSQKSTSLFAEVNKEDEFFKEEENPYIEAESIAFPQKLSDRCAKNPEQEAKLSPPLSENGYIEFTCPATPPTQDYPRKQSLILLRGETEYNSFFNIGSPNKGNESPSTSSIDQPCLQMTEVDVPLKVDHKECPIEGDWMTSAKQEPVYSVIEPYGDGKNDLIPSSMGGKVSRSKLSGRNKEANEENETDTTSDLRTPNRTNSGVLSRRGQRADEQSSAFHTTAEQVESVSPSHKPLSSHSTSIAGLLVTKVNMSNPSQRPLPPTPVHNEKMLDNPTEANEKPKEHSCLDRKSSFPQDPPPLPPTIDRPPPLLPRTNSSFAPKLPYRPPTKHLISEESELMTPPDSPVKHLISSILPDENNVSILKTWKMPTPSKVANSSTKDIEESLQWKDETKEDKTPLKNLHPIAAMIKYKQKNKASEGVQFQQNDIKRPLNKEKKESCNSSCSLAVNNSASFRYKTSSTPYPQFSSSPPCPNKPAPKNPLTFAKQSPTTQLTSYDLAPPKSPPIIPDKPYFYGSGRTTDASPAISNKSSNNTSPSLLDNSVFLSNETSLNKNSTIFVQETVGNEKSLFSTHPPPVPRKPEAVTPKTSVNHNSTTVISAGIITEKGIFNSLRKPPLTSVSNACSKMFNKGTSTKSPSITNSNLHKSPLHETGDNNHSFQTPIKQRKQIQGGYTLHKLQAERMVNSEKTTLPPDISKREPPDGNDHPTNTTEVVTVNNSSSCRIYSQIDDFPAGSDQETVMALNDSTAISSLAQAITSRGNLSRDGRLARSATFNGEKTLYSNIHPETKNHEISSSTARRIQVLKATKGRFKPRPSVPPPPRPDSVGIAKLSGTYIKAKQPPSRPPPPSNNNVLAAKLRKEALRLVERNADDEKSDTNYPNNSVLLHPSCQDSISLTPEEDTTYSAILDASGDSYSPGSVERRSNDLSSRFRDISTKKKTNLPSLVTSVSIIKNKLGKTRARTTNANIPGNFSIMASNVKESQSNTEQENCTPEGIYVGIDDNYIDSDTISSSNVYLTSLPVQLQETTTVAYAELDHGEFSENSA